MFNFNFQQKDIRRITKSSSYSKKNSLRGGANKFKNVGGGYNVADATAAKTTTAVPKYSFSGLQTVDNIYGVVVCVNYSDMLKLTLKSAVGQFNKLYVITDLKDKDTESLCSQYDFVELIKTDAFYENGNNFDKGSGINLGLERVPVRKDSWVLIFDADIVFPSYMKHVLSHKALDVEVLYGARRHFARTYEAYDRYERAGQDLTTLKEVYNPGGLPIGYYQLFNSQNLKFPNFRYITDQKNASTADMVFSYRFPKRTTLRSISVVHLGHDGINWSGRVTPVFGSSKTVADFDLDKFVHASRSRSKDICFITTPFGCSDKQFKNPVRNYNIFKAAIEQQADLFTTELVLDDDKPMYGVDDGEFKVTLHGTRDEHLLWQKERLINITAKRILDNYDYKYIGWVDSDVLFYNEDWLEKTCEALRGNLAVQMFRQCGLFDRNLEITYTDPHGDPHPELGSVQRYLSTAYAYASGMFNTDWVTFHRPTFNHVGFAWAARREFFEELGVQDKAVFGDGDTFIAAALAGKKVHATHRGHALGPSSAELFTTYSTTARDLAKRLDLHPMGFVDNTLYHLQHGDFAGKQYNSRLELLAQTQYDPALHLELDHNGLYRFTEFAPERLRTNLKLYFNNRQEDAYTNNYSKLETILGVHGV